MVVACLARPFDQFLNPEICSAISFDGRESGQNLSYLAAAMLAKCPPIRIRSKSMYMQQASEQTDTIEE